MVAGSVHTKVLPDNVKTLAAHLHSTKAGPDTKLRAHVPGTLTRHSDIYSLSIVPEPIDIADTFTQSLFLHLSTDEAPATAVGADDQCLFSISAITSKTGRHRTSTGSG